jgi:sensor histidine kinase regulating citrate/malate metabolism
MKGRGKLALKIEQDHDSIKISVTDSGNGIQKKQFKGYLNLVSPPKKRLGLGLSLKKGL